MNKIYYIPYAQDFLAHHGIKDQKWGVRRWQNKDGSLTPEGRIHYGYGEARAKTSEDFRANRARSWANSVSSASVFGFLNKHARQRKAVEVEKTKTRHDATMKARTEALQSKEVKDAEKKLDKVYKTVDDYYKLSGEELKEYKKRAADIAFEKYGDGTEEGREGFRKAYLYDDADQGSENSFVQYIKSKGLDPATESKKMYEAQKVYERAYEAAFKKSLESMGDKVAFSFADDKTHSVSDLDISMQNTAYEAAREAYEKIRNQKNYYNLLDM